MPEAVKKKREFTIERPRRRDIPTTKPVAVPAAHGMSPPEPSTLDVLTAIAALRRELSTLRDEWRSPTPEQLSVAA